jgi:DNA-binding transcriptional MerR regulator
MAPTMRLYGTGEVAALLGVPRWRLQYFIERGDVPGPSCILPGRRLFSDDDVNAIRQVLVARDDGTAKDGGVHHELAAV